MQQPKRVFQKLWIPEAISGKNFALTLKKTRKSFWPGATTTTCGFNGAAFWGPTLVLQKGERVQLDVTNALDEPTTCHWHGLHVPAAMDGGPHQLIAPGKTWRATFEVKNDAATLWYHPHAHETTQKQLTYGAGGFLQVKDPIEAALNLPRTYGIDDIPLVLTSRRFYQNNEFSFEGDRDKYGDFLLTNGTLDARATLPAQWVRLRILNAEIERAYNLGLTNDRTFYLIATDGGLIEKPLPLTRLVLSPGERAELLIDLSAEKPGAALTLMAFNSGQAFGFPGQEPGTSRPNGSLLNGIDFRLLQIQVGPPTARPVTKLPGALVKSKLVFAPGDVSARRTIRINGQPGGNPEFYFDGGGYKMHQTNHVVKLGATEAWTVVNNRVFGHAFHIHDVQFRIVERSYGPVPEYENGWKDTLYIRRNESVTFVARFDDYASETDPFMYHCHMSNHEDGGLMGEFLVVKDPQAFRPKGEHPVTAEMARAAQNLAGAIAPNLVATDMNQKSVRLSSLCATAPLVLYFIERGCPCSKDAAPLFEGLRTSFGSKCQVVGVIDAAPEVARAWARSAGVGFPILADPEQAIIGAFGAERSVYTTLLAPGGRVIKTYPGYSQATLRELEGRLAALTGLRPRPLAVASAPKTLTSGCEFPRLRKAG